MSQTGLQRPPGRQGPGPIPRPILERLDLLVTRRTTGALPGDRRASGVGLGTELAQLRPYEVGDDVRQIDAAATARLAQPYVRMHVPERTLTTWLAVDVSPSMAFGTAKRLKSDVAEGTAVALSRLAVRRAGRVALMTFGAGEPRLLPPRASRPGVVAVRRTLSDGVAPDGVEAPGSMREALIRLGRVANQPGLIVLISDFRDEHDWIQPLGALATRHSVMAVEVRDPRELELPSVGRLAVVDPETGKHVEVDTSSVRLRRRFARIEARGRERIKNEFRRLEVAHVVLSTGDDWLKELGRRLA